MSRDSPTLDERERMKSLMQFWLQVLNELGTQIGTDTSKDAKYALARFEDEGLSFLTITLTNYGSDLQKGLDRGYVAPDLFQGFSWSGGLPKFLRGFLERIFSRGDGRLLDNPEIDAIFAIRQITLMMGKLHIPCSDARVAKAISGYIECEKEVKIHDSTFAETGYSSFMRTGMDLFGKLFHRVNLRVSRGELMPKHGPGATADRLKGNLKYCQSEWPLRLEEFFPSLTFLTPGWSYFELLENVTYLEPGQERPVRVITVPKTLKTPRIIAIEPTCMQYAQQALLEVFLDELRRDRLLSKIMYFDDQTPNQRLALKGSSEGSLATLDLSEASDRVSNQHVRALLAGFPDFAGAVDACRSRKADVPGHGIIRLSKFASMGSALCFPFEAMVFTTIIFQAIAEQLNRRLTRELVEQFVGQVVVYGDDIIVPVDFVSAVVARLEAFGFRVNGSKSFWTGKFRESCGRDYYDGSDVSIVRVREKLPTRLEHATEVISTVSLRNQLYQLGLWKTCQWLDDRLDRVLKGRYPIVDSTSAVLGRHSMLPYQGERVHPYHHTPLVKGYVVDVRLPVSMLDGEPALLKYLLKRGREPLDRRHLERAGRPERVDLKLRWRTPY
jgi:hypothetical protein